MNSEQRDTLRILQLSDCHVSANPEAKYRGHNADHNLRSLIPEMKAWNPDRVLLSGDISEDASPGSYGRVADALGSLPVPLLALPGNHDNPDEMKRHFPLGPWRGPFAHRAGRWLLVMLDSTEPGRISGFIGTRDLETLDELFRADPAEHILLALHHQPVPVNAPWIDRYSLRDSRLLLELLDRTDRLRCVTWGHVHQEFQTRRKEVLLLGAPSSVANSLPCTPKFTLDPAGPACRWIELAPGGTVKTGILRPGQSSTGKTSQRIR